MTQFDDHAVMCRQGGERRADYFASFFDLNLSLRPLAVIGIPILVERRGGFSGVKKIQTKVRSDAPDPRTEVALEIEGVQAVVGSHEGFLSQVFGFARIMQDAVADVKYIRLVARDELAERVTLSATGTGEEVAVGGHGHG